MHGRAPSGGRRHEAAGFSLIEMIVTLTILAMVIGALSTVLIRATLVRVASSNRFESLQTARAATDLIARDLRSAGYGVDANSAHGAQPAIAYVDAYEILMCENQSPYPDAATAGAPEAYDPAGTPNPHPLVSGQWVPPCKYGTGAEIIRYTLDLTNDGLVDANDVASAEGVDARRSGHPDDFTLVRQVYGAGSGGVALNNGASPERIALVLKPGGDVPPLFTVYLNGSSTPWDWASGPVPAAQLDAITRIEIRVTGASGKPDARGQYSRTVIQTAVRSMRNVPDFGSAVQVVDGYVFQDKDADQTRDGNEPGIGGAIVRLGSGRVAYSTSSGYFSFRVPAGTYTLKHTPPSGFGTFSHPDSFVLGVASHETRSFADTARTGGWVTARVWDDTDGDAFWDAGESALSGVTLALTPGNIQAGTDVTGTATLFAQTGAWSVSATPPSNYSITTSHPVTGTMVSGGASSISVGMHKASNATVSGRVFTDSNTDGIYNGIDAGLGSVSVQAKDASGSSVVATATTAADGTYSLSVPANASAASGYIVTCATPTGKFPTTANPITNVKGSGGQALTGYDLGFGAYTTTTLTCGAVTGLVAADLWENDGATSATTRADKDLIVTDRSGSARYNLKYFYNGYPSSVFSTTANVTQDSYLPTGGIVVDTTSKLPTVGPPDIYVCGLYLGFLNYCVGWNRISASSAPPTSYLRVYAASGIPYSMAALDCWNGTSPELLVGTRISSGKGRLEVWKNNDASSVDFLTAELYPTNGSIPGSTMGEINAIAVADLNGDGLRDVIVGTSRSSTSGEILVFQYVSKTTGNRLVCQKVVTLASDAVTSLAIGDVDGDGRPDIVAGTQSGSSTGHVLVYRNTYATSAWSFTQLQSISAPGAVTSVAAGDFGASTGIDVIAGYGTSSVTYTGGARVYYNGGGTLSTTAVDPTGGTLTSWVTKIAVADFQYGSYPSAYSGTTRLDFAIGYKSGAYSGGVKVLTR